jgi:hypothetical protein
LLKDGWLKTKMNFTNFKQKAKQGWEATKRGYGKSVEFVAENTPKLERRFGRMAQTTTDAFKVRPTGHQIDFSIPRNDLRVPRRPMRPIKPRKQHDFGKLSFDI